MASLLRPGRALDLACGSGRHALWLRDHGWAVTAVDRNAEAIQGLRHSHPAIDARVADLEAGEFVIAPASWDLIVCWLYHQPNLYPAIREGLRPGGIAVLCALREGRFAAQAEDLLRAFAGFTVLHHVESVRMIELAMQYIK